MFFSDKFRVTPLTQRFRAASTLTAALLLTALGIALPAKSYEDEPIIVKAQADIVPGQPLACAVSLTGVPPEIHIVSDPPGVVNYHGPVSAANDVVQAQTDPDAAPGPVTIYLTVNGTNAVSDTAMVMSYEDEPIIVKDNP